MPRTHELITAIGYLHETYKIPMYKGEVLSGLSTQYIASVGRENYFIFEGRCLRSGAWLHTSAHMSSMN